MQHRRSRNFPSKDRYPPEGRYQLDLTKNPEENVNDIISHLYEESQEDFSLRKLLSLVNALSNVAKQCQNKSELLLGYNCVELLYCLSPFIFHRTSEIRAATFRVIRYILKSPKDLQVFNYLQFPNLVARSLDIQSKNDEERIQALKLIRKMLVVSPDNINPIVIRCLVSHVDNGIEDSDRFLRSCLAILSECGVLNPIVLITCGGVSALTRNIVECCIPRISESMCGVLLHLLEWPVTRKLAEVNLNCLGAPYCDFTYRLGIMDKNKHARDLRFTSSRLALLSILRSWNGLLEFGNPTNTSGLKALVDVLHLNQMEVRKAILDLFYELFNIPQPVWTDEYSVALAVIDPSDYQDSWRLSEGFVAMEGKQVLPCLANRVPNVVELQLSLLLYCLLDSGILDALTQVVVTSETFISVRATILLGKIIQLIQTILPMDLSDSSAALPKLVDHAAQGNENASAAIIALQKYMDILRNRPSACSVFLDNIIRSGEVFKSNVFNRDASNQLYLSDNDGVSQMNGTLERTRLDSTSSSASTGPNENRSVGGTLKKSDKMRLKRFRRFLDGIREHESLIRESNVLSNKDVNTWDWTIILSVIKSDALTKRDENHSRFLKKIVRFFMPSSNRFSHQELGHGKQLSTTITVGMELIDWLDQSNDMYATRLLTELFQDIKEQLTAIESSRSAHDCLFSPLHVANTMCQIYFAFIGRLCRTLKGLFLLNKLGIIDQLQSLVENTNHICYLKLIITGLDYSFGYEDPNADFTIEIYPRKILRTALTSHRQVSFRLYATQFLLVLMRAKIKNFEDWGLEMLVDQTKDTERSIVLTALEILEEATYERDYLEQIVSLWPKLDNLGDNGRAIMTRFYSISRGINDPKAHVDYQINYWQTYYNKRYVLLIEANTHSSLTLHTKSEDGTYSRRTCLTRNPSISPNIIPHLYGQLVQTTQGLTRLRERGNLIELVQKLTFIKCNNEIECLNMKAALWALGHASTSTEGLEFLNTTQLKVTERIIAIAKCHEVYSIRATAFQILGLIGSTNAGANLLSNFDWVSVRHERNTCWPVRELDDWYAPTNTSLRTKDLAPYNYERLDFTTDDSIIFPSCQLKTMDGDISAPCFFDEKLDNIEKIEKITESLGGEPSGIRQKTVSISHPEEILKQKKIKHKRSMSESKTTEGLNLLAKAHSSRIRFNSGTDSNTSGVSSCDSIFGQMLIRDLQHTLSPIPSTSNLTDAARIPADCFNRSTYVNRSFRHITPNQRDSQGIKMLRSLRRSARPRVSESAADDLAEIINGEVNIRSNRTALMGERKKVVRSIDFHTLGEIIFPAPCDPLAGNYSYATSAKLFNHVTSSGPCYIGISLPRNIMDIFPKGKSGRFYISRYIEELDVLNTSIVSNSIINERVQFQSETYRKTSRNSFETLSSPNNTFWENRHNRSDCIQCCRLNGILRPDCLSRENSVNSPNETPPIETHSPSNMVRLDPTSSKEKTESDCNLEVSSISTNNETSSVTSNPDLNISETLIEKQEDETVSIKQNSVIHHELAAERVSLAILEQISNLANPVWSKQSKAVLLDLKRKNPSVFQDVCLYSEASKLLGQNTYRLYARHFVQELFSDVQYDVGFYEEAKVILAQKINLRGNESTGEYSGNRCESDRMSTDKSMLSSVAESSSENLIANVEDVSLQNDSMKTGQDSVIDKSNEVKLRPRASTFGKLELDLNCTKNKFPIKHRDVEKVTTPVTPTSSIIFQSTSTVRPQSLTSPTITGSLFCEQRLQSAKSNL